jgi:hypothetical protein
MGVVWRAMDTVLGREGAIKEVQVPATLPDDERARMRGRVMREARVDPGEDQETADGRVP